MLERSGDSFFLGPGRQQNTMRAAALNAQMTSRPLKEKWRPHGYAFAIRLNELESRLVMRDALASDA